MSTIAERVAANLGQAEANLAWMDENRDGISLRLGLVKSAKWRLVRNARLLRQSRELLAENKRLLNENDRLLAGNAALLAAHQAGAA
jgi:hypothetical protein